MNVPEIRNTFPWNVWNLRRSGASQLSAHAHAFTVSPIPSGTAAAILRSRVVSQRRTEKELIIEFLYCQPIVFIRLTIILKRYRISSMAYSVSWYHYVLSFLFPRSSNNLTSSTQTRSAVFHPERKWSRISQIPVFPGLSAWLYYCLLYTSDAADEL